MVDRDVHILVAACGVNGSFSPEISDIDMSKLIASPFLYENKTGSRAKFGARQSGKESGKTCWLKMA
ncbi:hypothetical protein KIP88_20700 [Bradyrhizobium sp. SRL28]|uniref:hypothetical protein n=1 Tax=Bradyrhizobium sp. SRL28 TaxID=2836178 RepID=UPI001BDEC57D|nr:hypothetical protein [Bradyrhizobium sp. SRL28]MBT1512915.1 hypothetical protein [Bradyrhizobium sp. SRL28]